MTGDPSTTLAKAAGGVRVRTSERLVQLCRSRMWEGVLAESMSCFGCVPCSANEVVQVIHRSTDASGWGSDGGPSGYCKDQGNTPVTGRV